MNLMLIGQVLSLTKRYFIYKNIRVAILLLAIIADILYTIFHISNDNMTAAIPRIFMITVSVSALYNHYYGHKNLTSRFLKLVMLVGFVAFLGSFTNGINQEYAWFTIAEVVSIAVWGLMYVNKRASFLVGSMAGNIVFCIACYVTNTSIIPSVAMALIAFVINFAAFKKEYITPLFKNTYNDHVRVFNPLVIR